MTGRRGAVVPIVDQRRTAPRDAGSFPVVTTARGIDARGRGLRDLRISVTDRCNFRCTYCMPKEIFDRDHPFLPHADLLTFEEIAAVARAFVALGVEKVRLTGGEPLLRKGIESLVEQLAAIELPARPDAPEGPRRLELALTTNGSLLRRKAVALRAAGLGRVTVSLDALDDARFRAMNDVDYPVAAVLDGIDAAGAAGLAPVKVNMVVKRGVNDDQILPMVDRFRGTGHVLRLIEFMDVGTTNRWQFDHVVPSAEAAALIDARWPIEPLQRTYRGEVAERWRFVDGAGEIGFISSVSQAFCGDCTRARLSPEGSVYTCLFGSQGHDLRSLIRDGADVATLADRIASIWAHRGDRYSELRGTSASNAAERVEMSFIGG